MPKWYTMVYKKYSKVLLQKIKNGNVLVVDNRNASNISVEPVAHEHTLRYVTFRVTNRSPNSSLSRYDNFGVTIDAMGKITFQHNDNVVSLEDFSKALNSLIEG